MLTDARTTEEMRDEAEPELPELDVRAARQVDDLESFINRNVTEVGHRWEAIADRSFDTLFDGDVSAALAGRKFATAKYDALARRVGTSLQIDLPALSRAVRIGAVNHRLQRSDWSTLSWSVKVELLPLLGAEQDFALLEKGVKSATEGTFGQREARQWVAEHRSNAGGDEPKTPKLTPLKAGKVFEFGAALRKVAARRELTDKVLALEEEAQKAFLAALADTLRNLGKLQQELTQADDGE